jgi:hypothetical protein
LGTGKLDPMDRGLDDDVLLGMKTSTQLMPLTGGDIQLFAQAPLIQAVSKAGRCSIVPGAQDALVFDCNRPHLSAQAGGPFRHQKGDAHEIFRPRQALGHENIL